MDQQIAGASPAGNVQSQIEAAVQTATAGIHATNKAAIREMEKAFDVQKQVITSMWESKCSEAQTQADRSSRKNKELQKELEDMQDQLQDFYERELKREEEDKKKAPARDASDAAC